MSKAWVKILLSIIIFGVSVAAYYYPISKKGFAPGASYLNLTQARNFALSGTYLNESAEGIYLSSGSAQEKGEPRGVINPLTPVIYGHIFKYFGFNSVLPIYLSITLFSLFNVLIFFLAARIFSTLIGFVSGLVSAFVPIMAVGAIYSGFYEWAIIFFGVALWFYLGSKRGPFRAGIVRILVASIFFSLAALSRNAFAISFVPFFLYDFLIHRSYRRALIFLLPFLIIFGSTLTSYSWLGVPNGYKADIENQPFDQVGHFFPDPYTFNYERDNFVEEKLSGSLSRPEVLFASRWGHKVGIMDRINAYFDSLTFYIKELVSLTAIGGPFIWGLIVLGIFKLYSLNKKVLGLFTIWGGFWLVYLIFEKTGNWNHVMEIIFILASLVGLGFYSLVENMGAGKIKRIFAGSLLLAILISHLAYANKWKLHDVYRSSKESAVLDAKEETENLDMPEGVYAVGIHPSSVHSLNYHINHDVVYFSPETVERLILSGNLEDAFDKYDISVAVGYSSEISSKINKELNIPAISHN